jgi:hypothetical protein
MFPTDPSTPHQLSIFPDRQVEIGLIVVEVDYHDQLYASYSADDLRCARKIAGDAFRTVAQARGGTLFSWEGDQITFLFPVEDVEGLDNYRMAALLMLDMMPCLCDDLRATPDLERPITAHVACDIGKIPTGPEVHGTCRRLLARLAGSERPRNGGDEVTVTGRVYDRLTEDLKARFVGHRHSTALGVDLHSTSTFAPPSAPVPAPAPAAIAAPGAPPPPTYLPIAPNLPASPDISTVHGPAGKEAVRPPGLAVRPETWFLAGVAATALLFGGYLLVWRSTPRTLVPATEVDRSAAWTAWRTQVHKRLWNAEPTEETMRRLLEVRPPAPESTPAAALRHDQATAEVLLGYPSVRTLLKNLVGIDDHFFGTGLSRPAGADHYREASVHEYLIPNLRDDEASVWMEKLNPSSLDLFKSIKQLVEGNERTDEASQRLKREITLLCEGKKQGTVLVRFARFDVEKYRHTLGPPGRVRVFASDLSEVWNLPIKEAADLSGYSYTGKGGDTFFIWIFIPLQKEEAVAATWEEVLSNLPGWMKEARDRSASGAASPEGRRSPATIPK